MEYPWLVVLSSLSHSKWSLELGLFYSFRPSNSQGKDPENCYPRVPFDISLLNVIHAIGFCYNPCLNKPEHLSATQSAMGKSAELRWTQWLLEARMDETWNMLPYRSPIQKWVGIFPQFPVFEECDSAWQVRKTWFFHWQIYKILFRVFAQNQIFPSSTQTYNVRIYFWFSIIIGLSRQV